MTARTRGFRSRSKQVTAFAVVGALALAACGNTDDDSADRVQAFLYAGTTGD